MNDSLANASQHAMCALAEVLDPHLIPSNPIPSPSPFETAYF
jgi:hypothetical protein